MRIKYLSHVVRKLQSEVAGMCELRGIQTSRAVPRALPSHFIASVLIRERALWRALPKISRMRSGFVFGNGNGNESRQTEWDRIVHESGLRSMYPTLPAAAIRALSGDWNAW